MSDTIIAASLQLNADQAREAVKSIKQELKDAQKDLGVIKSKFGELSPEAVTAAKKVDDLGKKFTEASKAADSFKSVKQQLRDANNELVRVVSRFGELSPEAAKAAKRVAELNDQIGDSKKLADAFSPDSKFKAFSNTLQGVAGGFSAVTGGMALLGDQSEDTEKTLLKVQAAFAFSQGLNQLGELKDTFKQLGAFIQTTTVYQNLNTAATKVAGTVQKLFGIEVDATSTSFKGLKAAIAATGIGLLIIGVVALVTHFDELKEALGFASKAQKAYSKTAEEGAKAAMDAVAGELKSIYEVRNAFELAKSGVISKKEALQKYNDTLGDTFGRTNDLATAEKNLNAKADAYIKVTMLKAQATVFFQKAAEAAAKGLTAELEDQTTWIDNTISGLKGFFGNYTSAATGLVDAQEKGVKKAKAQSKSISEVLQTQGADLLKQADTISKSAGIQTKEQQEIRKQNLQDAVQHYQDLIKVAQAQGKDTYDLELKMWKAKLQTAESGSAEYKSIIADMTAFQLSHSKGLADGLKEENLKQKQFLEDFQKQIDEANKNISDSKKNQRQKDLDGIELNYKEEKTALQKSVDDRIRDAENAYKAHKISLEKLNSDRSDILKKQEQVEVSLTNEKEARKKEVEEKYSKEINNFINGFNDSAYQQQRKKLIEDFDEKIKVADEKQKELLEKTKSFAVDKLDSTHNAEVNVTKTETNVIKTTRENEVTAEDPVEEMKAKTQRIADAQIEAENAAYELKKINAQTNAEELELIEQQHEDNVLAIQKKAKDDEKAIDEARLTAKIDFANAVGGVISNLSGLFKKGTAAAKITALAEIAIGTGTGFINALDIAQKSAKATGPGAAFAFPIFYATQIAAVLGAAAKAKSILSSGGGGGSAPTSAAATPAAPLTPTVNTTKIDADDINNIGNAAAGGVNKPQRNYVLSGDIQSDSERDARLQRAALLGGG